MDTKKDTHFYRADLDGLRAIAVSIVVAYHAIFTGFTGGYIGVDVFFVISGYLITGLLYKEINLTGSISFSSFFSKRFKRLFPALVFLILSVLLIWSIFFLGITKNTSLFLKSIPYSLFGLANIFFKKNTGGYFDLSSEELPLLHFWSLAVEEQFYLLWPFLIFLGIKFNPFFYSSSKKIILVLSLVCFSSFIYTEFLILNNDLSNAFYSMPARAWELAIGGILFFAYPFFKNLSFIYLNLIGLLGLILILVATTFFDNETRFPGLYALVPVLGTSLLILSGGHGKSKISKILSQKSLVKIGTLSYGWYLWHWPLLALERIYFMGELPPLEWRILAILVSLILAHVSLVYIEIPVRFGKKIGRIKPRNVIFAGFAAGLFIIFISKGVKFVEQMQMPSDYAQIAQYAKEETNAEFGCEGEVLADIKKKCIVSNLVDETQKIPEIIVWGDSHARSYFPLFEEFIRSKKGIATLFSGASLIPIKGVDKIYYSKKNEIRELADQNKKILDNLKTKLTSGKPVTIVLIARWAAYTGVKPISIADGKVFVEEEKNDVRSFEIIRNNFKATLKDLNQAGAHKIVIFFQTPEFKYHVLDCYKQTKCDTSLREFEIYRSKMVVMLQEEASLYRNVRILDPIYTLCDENKCPQIVIDEHGRRIPVVSDDDHISLQAALYVGRRNNEILEWMIQ